MTIYIYLVRHAQGQHNVAADHTLRDPDLTALGIEQSTQLAISFPYHDRITHLISSPMRRTLRTCFYGFKNRGKGDDNGTRKPILALPELQELSTMPCDVGSSVAKLDAEFNTSEEKVVDLSELPDGWQLFKLDSNSLFAPNMDRLEKRAWQARRRLREIGQKYERDHPGQDAHIVVVSHGAFIHFLTGDWEGMTKEGQAGTDWRNAEWRVFEFVEGDEDEVRLRETEESWRRRKGDTPRLTETQQRELKTNVERVLEEDKKEWKKVTVCFQE